MNLYPAHDDDHPPGERFPWCWTAAFISVTCATVWVVIWGVGMW